MRFTQLWYYGLILNNYIAYIKYVGNMINLGSSNLIIQLATTYLYVYKKYDLPDFSNVSI